MIACFIARELPAEGIAERIAASLGLFDGSPSAVFRDQRAIFAQRFSHLDAAQGVDKVVAVIRPLAGRRSSPGRSAPARSTSGRSTWQPVTAPSGRTVLFTGTLDNDDELRAALGTRLRDPAALYGAALDRWGDSADRRVVGTYASLVFDPERRALRLARSPWSAPPLHYFTGDDGIGAASVLRALHVCGLSRELNRRKFADSMFNNLTEQEGWYDGGFEVQLGTSVHLSFAGVERTAFYDHLEQREPIRFKRAEDYVEAAGALLDESVGKALRGSRKPAVQLSGGLDSSNVAARVLAALAPDQRLNTYTFVPHPDYAGPVPVNYYASEREKVEAMAAMHPRLDARFCDNRDSDLDRTCDKLFLAMGVAPDPLPNVFPMIGVYDAARDDGCDLMLGAGSGNFNISQDGEWGFVEYLRQGRWVQLYRAVANTREKTCGFPRRLFTYSIKPLLPLWAQRAIANRHGDDTRHEQYSLTPLKPAFLARHQIEERARAAQLLDERPFRTSRAIAMREMFARGEMNGADTGLAMEQIYGMPGRDVTAYRPLMEFCHAVPTDCFLRDGTGRWLARELGRGRLPDAIRLERRAGMPQPDWHLRMSRRLPQIRAELAEAEADPILAEMIDFAELRARLDRFPAEPSHDSREVLEFSMSLPRAVMAARFARFVSGRNAA